MLKNVQKANFGLLVLCLIYINSQLPIAAAQEPETETDAQDPSSATTSDSAGSPADDTQEAASDETTKSGQIESETISSAGSNETNENVETALDAATSSPTENPTRNDAADNPSGSQAPSPSSSWTDKIKVKGDFRYRVEMIGQQDTELRYRHRIRARVGLIADILDDLQATVQVGTGESDDPVSNNQSLTEAFSSKPLWLDLAFFDWYPSYFYNAHIVGGKMKNPFYKVGETELLWDPDLNPEGMALTYKDTFGIVEPFLNTGIFWLQERKADDDSWFFGGQAGARFNLFDGGFYVLVGGGYVDYMNLKGQPLLWDTEDAFGNSSDPIEDSDGDGELDADLRYRYDYNLIDGFVEIGGEVVGLPWAAFSDFVVNTQADEDNIGWLAGISLGETEQAFDYHFRYIYREVKRDATVGIFTDSDFIGGGTDGKGHEFNFGLQLSKGAKAAITYFYNKKGLDNPIDFHRAQFDIKLKF